MISNKKLLIGIYFHPENFPPTLNAIEELSDIYEEIILIHRPFLQTNWIFPKNVTVIPSGQIISVRDQEKANYFLKIKYFLHFTYTLLYFSIKKRVPHFLFYDTISLLSYRIIKFGLFFKHSVWYHNHDVAELDRLRKFSIGWFAAKNEKLIFKKLDIFSLPTNERLPYFNMQKFTGKYFCIPNYPSIKFYSQFYIKQKTTNEIRLIFQGSIGQGHGIEEIIGMLSTKIEDKMMRLILKGSIDEEYKQSLVNLSENLNVSDRIEYYGYTSYSEVPRIASTCHIGIAIFAKKDIMNLTLGTSSNKIYEYAALGLPIIYFKDSTITQVLQSYNWAKNTELNSSSIIECVKNIMIDYKELSLSAHQDFIQTNNFEKVFYPVKQYYRAM